MSCILKRGGVWYLKWSEGGRVAWRSTRIRIATDPKGTIARQIQRDFDSARAKQLGGLEDERVTIEEGFRRYLASIRRASPAWIADSRKRAERWTTWLSRRKVETWEQITPPLIDDYLEVRANEVSAKTQLTELDLLKATARLLNKSRTIKPIPVDTWPSIERVTSARPERVGAYSLADVEAILADMDHPRRRHWRFPILCLAYLGARWSEMARITIRDVRLSPAPPMVRLGSTKTGTSVRNQLRWVEIHPRLLPPIKEAMKGRRPDDPLIENLPSNRDGTNVMTRCCERLGIQYRRLHGFRHFWISTMLATGVPLAVVMKMAGHTNISTTQGYLHLPDTHAGWVGKALPDAAEKVIPKLIPVLAKKGLKMAKSRGSQNREKRH